jgi:hypothetical protein
VRGDEIVTRLIRLRVERLVSHARVDGDQPRRTTQLVAAHETARHEITVETT